MRPIATFCLLTALLLSGSILPAAASQAFPATLSSLHKEPAGQDGDDTGIDAVAGASGEKYVVPGSRGAAQSGTPGAQNATAGNAPQHADGQPDATAAGTQGKPTVVYTFPIDGDIMPAQQRLVAKPRRRPLRRRRTGADPAQHLRRTGQRRRLDPHDDPQFAGTGLGLYRQPGRFGRGAHRDRGRAYLHASGRQYRRSLGRGPERQADARQVPELHARDDARDGRSARQGDRTHRRRRHPLALAARPAGRRGDGRAHGGRQHDRRGARLHRVGKRRNTLTAKGRPPPWTKCLHRAAYSSTRCTNTPPRGSTACWAG